jgi:hypothetical protein
LSILSDGALFGTINVHGDVGCSLGVELDLVAGIRLDAVMRLVRV